MAELNGVSDRWLPDAFACVLTGNGGKLLKSSLAEAAKEIQPGPKTTQARPDHSGHTQDATAGNKTSPATAPVKLAAGAPDLVVTSLRTEPVNPSVRETVRLFVDVQNQGSIAVPAGTVTSLALRIEGDGKLINLVSYVHTTGLAPGERATIEKGTNGPWTGSLAFGSNQPGTFKVTMKVDPDNQIAEADEANNTLVQAITYLAPPRLTS
jgi:subtilase family serine protease